MITTIYLMRHSEPLKGTNYIINNDSLQVRNEKNPLSVTGEKKAEVLSKQKEFQNIDSVFSSNYVRAVSTAKYFSNVNNISLNIDENFGERKFGIDSWEELPQGFEKNQITDPNFKMPKGECQTEVANRMYESLLDVLNTNKGKRVIIVSHATAITFLFIKLGLYKNDCISFNNKILIDKDFVWNAPEVFKLTFDEDKLIDIINIRY